MLTRVFPPGILDEVIAECGRTEQRHRSLSARTVAYFVIGLALHSGGSYEDVLALISDGLAWAQRGEEPVRLAGKGAITHARKRLGAEPLRQLFARVARPLAEAGAPGSFLAGRRLVAINETCLDVADTPINEGFFGRPEVTRGERTAFPQARVVAVVECGSHAIVDAVVGAYSVPWPAAASELLDRFQPGMLCLADRGFSSHAAWRRAQETGADLCWAVAPNLKLPVVEQLPDGSWISEVFDSHGGRKREHGTRVRVIEYATEDDRGPVGPCRLITTILDPDDAPAAELAAAYAQRWEIDTAFDEMKIHQRGPRRVLRSGTPELVCQEIWGHLCCHYAIRTLMFDGAHSSHDPDTTGIDTARII